MTEPDISPEDEIEQLRARAKDLEGQLSDVRETARAKLVRSELKAHAVRAGIVDLDGLKLVETDGLNLTETGELEGAATLIASLRKRKPWLFGGASSSSGATVPQSAPLTKKLATQMSTEEWRTARAEILRNR
jgi:hypothetical protein